jgi:hypothetical protein
VCVCVGMAPCEPLDRYTEQNRNRTRINGGNANAEPVALVALPGETLVWPPAKEKGNAGPGDEHDGTWAQFVIWAVRRARQEQTKGDQIWVKPPIHKAIPSVFIVKSSTYLQSI